MVTQLYTLYYGELQRYLTGRLQNPADAEDITQETFLRALSHTPQLEEMNLSQCRAWLYRTAKNLMADRFRHRIPFPIPKSLAAINEILPALKSKPSIAL